MDGLRQLAHYYGIQTEYLDVKHDAPLPGLGRRGRLRVLQVLGAPHPADGRSLRRPPCAVQQVPATRSSSRSYWPGMVGEGARPAACATSQ